MRWDQRKGEPRRWASERDPATGLSPAISQGHVVRLEPPSFKPRDPMSDRAATLIRGRRERMSRLLGRSLPEPVADTSPLPSESRSYLLDEALDLYWNELEWEHLTEEESVTQGEPLVELMFPGLLAFVRGLLLSQVNPDALAPAEPRPVVVEDLLGFLAGRVLELDEALAAGDPEDRERHRGELRMTNRLIDLVLYLFHGLAPEAIHLLETSGTG